MAVLVVAVQMIVLPGPEPQARAITADQETALRAAAVAVEPLWALMRGPQLEAMAVRV
jgi:hypothetical protein